jgi:hypothetical protein
MYYTYFCVNAENPDARSNTREPQLRHGCRFPGGLFSQIPEFQEIPEIFQWCEPGALEKQPAASRIPGEHSSSGVSRWTWGSSLGFRAPLDTSSGSAHSSRRHGSSPLPRSGGGREGAGAATDANHRFGHQRSDPAVRGFLYAPRLAWGRSLRFESPLDASSVRRQPPLQPSPASRERGPLKACTGPLSWTPPPHPPYNPVP